MPAYVRECFLYSRSVANPFAGRLAPSRRVRRVRSSQNRTPERFQKRRNDIIDHSNPVSMTSFPFHRCDVVTSASEEDSDEAENRLEAVPETAPEFPNTEIRCSIRKIGARDRSRAIALRDGRRMRTTEPFTIKQCNRVADAWSVVCGPGAPVPPLSLHSFHYHHSVAVSPPLRGSLRPVVSSFLLSFPFARSPALRDALPSTLDAKVVTHPAIGYYDRSGIPRRPVDRPSGYHN